MSRSARRGAQVAATLLILAMTVFVCLTPKPENDLFFELRTGTEILRTGHLPHFDTYSWTRLGTRWDVPEWGAFVLYALAYRAGGFFGTWLLMTGVTVAAFSLVWAWLVRRTGLTAAFLLAALTLVAAKDCLQERPYVFTYLLLPIALILLLHARSGRPKILLGLIPLCAFWANLHQGVLVVIGLLLVYALGDGVQAARGKPGAAASAGRMLGMAALCAGAALVSPYGPHLYTNVWITLRSPSLMANVTEWNSAVTLPPVQLQPLLALAVAAFGSLALSSRPRLPDTLAALALFGQALLHARSIPLFALGGVVILAPHLPPAVQKVRLRLGLAPIAAPRPALVGAFALLLAAAVGLLSLGSLKRESLKKVTGTHRGALQDFGEAVAELPRCPENACAFMDAESLPTNLRLLNEFEAGGYLLWRRPRQPVFVDGRLDVYVGQTFDDMVTLARSPGSPAWAALCRRYDFDAVLTTRKRETAAFTADPQWQLVYADPKGSPQHARLFLRRRPQFAVFIARCLHDRPLAPSKSPERGINTAAQAGA